jgi:hypothetical protein
MARTYIHHTTTIIHVLLYTSSILLGRLAAPCSRCLLQYCIYKKVATLHVKGKIYLQMYLEVIQYPLTNGSDGYQRPLAKNSL